VFPGNGALDLVSQRDELMLKAIELENFKAFGERNRIELAPITLSPRLVRSASVRFRNSSEHK
jgi:hypothetical protein